MMFSGLDGKALAGAGFRRRLGAVAPLLALWLAGCTTTQPYPREHAACYERMQQQAAQLLPAFEALGHRPEIQLHLDEEMRDGRGFRQSPDIMGDALPGGRVRLRPSRVCDNVAIGRAVVAHEMAHVALQHRGAPGSGIVLQWERPPQQEMEADELALAVLLKAGGSPLAVRFIECRLRGCGGSAGGSGTNPAFRR